MLIYISDIWDRELDAVPVPELSTKYEKHDDDYDPKLLATPRPQSPGKTELHIEYKRLIQ